MEVYSKRFSLFIFLLLTHSCTFSYWVAADIPRVYQESDNVSNQWGNVSFSIMAGAYNKWDQIDQQLRLMAAQKKREQHKKEQEEYARRQRQQEAQQRARQELCKRRAEYKEKHLLISTMEEWKLFNDIHQERRLCALQNFDPAKIVKRNYVVSEKTKSFISKYGNAQEYQQCRGNEFQQVLHQELLDMQAQAADLVVDKEYQDTIGSLGELAHQANKQGGVLFTSRLLDICWGLLECGQAVAHGAKDGVFNTVDACCHPTKTAKEMAHGIVKTACAMAYVVK